MEQPQPESNLPSQLFKPSNFFSLSGLATAVWMFSYILGTVIGPDTLEPKHYRIMALLLSEVLAFLMVLRSSNKKMEYWLIAVFNGFLIFINASGLNSITTNMAFEPPSANTKTNQVKAGFFDFSTQVNWWPDEKLAFENKQLEDAVAQLKDSISRTAAKHSEFDSTSLHQFVPIVSAKNTSLVVGQVYEGELYFGTSAFTNGAKMFVNGTEVKIKEHTTAGGTKMRYAPVSFPVAASSYDEYGVSERSFKVGIKTEDSPMTEEVIRYRAIRPMVRFEGSCMATLYNECGNEVAVSIPGLADLSGLALSASADEGKIIKLSPGKFVIIPQRPKINVNVLLNGSLIQTEVFQTKNPPMPVGILKVGNGEYDNSKGIPVNTTVVTYVPEVLDYTFKMQNPKDANYRIVSMNVQVDGKAPIALKSGTFDLVKCGARRGSTISIMNVQVVRSTWDPSDADDKAVLGSKMSGIFQMAKQ